jgi:hypothetical protein
MKKILISTLAIVMLCGASTSHATVVTFDDVIGAIPNGYMGLDWGSNTLSTEVQPITDIYGANGYANGVVSGGNVLLVGNRTAAGAWNDSTPFDFNGVYLTGAWRNNLLIYVSGLKLTSLGMEYAYVASVIINSDRPTYFNANFQDVNWVTFSVENGPSIDSPLNLAFPHNVNDPLVNPSDRYQFVLDNFTFNEPEPIPEPSTLLLLGGALAGLGMFRRRRLNNT